MQNYFYSKFDNINWRWWKPDEIQSEKKATLESINRQLICYFPANYLVYTYVENFLILVSERNQIDRDNAGRAFSFRNFSMSDKNEIKSAAKWLDFLHQFNNPIDYHLPENTEIPLILNRNYIGIKQKMIFESLFEHCVSGDKFCIKNDDISEVNRRSDKDINSLNFNNFPDGSLFLDTLGLLPFNICKQVSFCFNYEDDFININDDKLSFIKIIFCGSKSIVAETFHLDEKINFTSVSRQGFKINDISNPIQNDLRWGSLYNFLTNENNRESLIILNSIYEKYSQRLTNKSIQELTSVYLEIYALLNPDDSAISNIEFLHELIENAGLSDSIKRNILQSYLNKIDFLYTLNHLYELTLLCKNLSLTEELDNKLLNNSSHSELNNVDLAAILNDRYFNELSKPIKAFLVSNITSTALKFKDLLDANYFTAYNKAVKAIKKNENFDYLWKELDSSGINFSNSSNYKAIQNLFSLTNNEKEYSNFLEKQYHTTSDNFWLTEIKKNNFKIKLNGNINSLDDCLTYWNKINASSKEVFEKSSAKDLYTLIVKFIQSFKDFVTLSSFYQNNAFALQNSQSSNYYEPLNKIIEIRVSELFNDLLESDRSQFNTVIDQIANDDISKKTLYSLFSNSQIYLHEINSKRKVIRVLELLKAIRIKDANKLAWLTTILNKINLKEDTGINDKEDLVEERFRKSITAIKGWKQIENNIIKELKVAKGWKVGKDYISNKLKISSKFLSELPKSKKRRYMIILSGLAILIFVVVVIHNQLPGKNSTGTVSDNNLNGKNDSVTNIPKMVDSNILILNEAEYLLNTSFLGSPGDTLDFFEFIKKRKEILFIKFAFDSTNFSIYKVKSIDTIKGNIMWNTFVKKYNDSTIKTIELQTVHTLSDSFSKIYRIKIIPK